MRIQTGLHLAYCPGFLQITKTDNSFLLGQRRTIVVQNLVLVIGLMALAHRHHLAERFQLNNEEK